MEINQKHIVQFGKHKGEVWHSVPQRYLDWAMATLTGDRLAAVTAEHERRKLRPTNPGGEQAVANGCTCPVVDNVYGSGQLAGDKREFIINTGCPLHDR